MATMTLRPQSSTTTMSGAGVQPFPHLDRRHLSDAMLAREARLLGYLARTTPGHLARTTLETARTEGVRAACREMISFEGFLKAFRAHLLEAPLDVRGDSYNAALALIELVIWRDDRNRRHC